MTPTRLVPAGLHLPEEKDPESDEQEVRQEVEEERPDRRPRVLGLDDDVLLAQPLQLLVGVLDGKPDGELLGVTALHVHALLEVANDRDRAALAHRHRLLAPLLGERGARLRQHRIVEGKLDRGRAAEIGELSAP